MLLFNPQVLTIRTTTNGRNIRKNAENAWNFSNYPTIKIFTSVTKLRRESAQDDTEQNYDNKS
jgi:hypothetical protein